MKQFFLSLMFVVLALVASTASAAVTANTVTVERIFTSNMGAAMTSHTYTLRLVNQATCAAKELALNGVESTITLAGRPIAVMTLAKCNSVDYSVQY